MVVLVEAVTTVSRFMTPVAAELAARPPLLAVAAVATTTTTTLAATTAIASIIAVIGTALPWLATIARRAIASTLIRWSVLWDMSVTRFPVGAAVAMLGRIGRR